MVVVVKRLARVLLCREHGQVRDLAPDLLQRAPRLRFDVLASRRHELLAPGLAALVGLRDRGLRRLAGAGDDVVGLLAGLLEAEAVLVQQLVGLSALALGGLDVVRDRGRALVERVLDPREREPLEHVHRDQEEEQRPDHQAEARGDQEATAARLLTAAVAAALRRGVFRRGEHESSYVAEKLQVAGLEEEGDEAEDERVEGDSLRQSEAEPADRLELIL